MAGYPEYQLPGPDGNTFVYADGLRSQDGAAIEAKHIRNPDCTPRTLDAVQLENPPPWDADIFDSANDEMVRYGKALQTAGTPVKFVEVNVDDEASVGYWDYMLTKHHVKGYAR